MTNIETEVKGDILTIKINLSETHGRSGSGKSEVIATTRGNVKLKDGISLGINCYKPVSL